MFWTIIFALLFVFVVLPTLGMIVVSGVAALADARGRNIPPRRHPHHPAVKWIGRGFFVAAIVTTTYQWLS